MGVLDDLISMGLTSGEGRVCLALLKMGPAKVGQVERNLMYHILRYTMC